MPSSAGNYIHPQWELVADQQFPDEHEKPAPDAGAGFSTEIAQLAKMRRGRDSNPRTGLSPLQHFQCCASAARPPLQTLWAGKVGAIYTMRQRCSTFNDKRMFALGVFLPARYNSGMERTLIILKPDAVQRGLCGQILARFEQKGLQIVAMKFLKRCPGARRDALRGSSGKAFLRGAGEIHDQLAGGRAGTRSEGRDHDCPQNDGAPQPARRPNRARFAGISGSATLTTSSTAPILPKAQPASSLFFKPEELTDWQPTSRTWIYDMAKGTPE